MKNLDLSGVIRIINTTFIDRKTKGTIFVEYRTHLCFEN